MFSSDDPTVLEYADLVNEVATFIMKKHEWQALTKIETITGDGVTAAFDQPADYDRMLIASRINDPRSWFWGYENISSIADWLILKNSGYNLITPGGWTLLGNQFNFLPAPPTRQSAQFPYISNRFVRSNTNQPKAQFDSDTDTFVLSERLLTLGLVWMWRQQKGMGSGQEEVDFMAALSEEIARDKGARAIRGGGRQGRWNGNSRFAYPLPLGN